MPDCKLLVVNADDFGFTSDVNAGIVHAHKHGILTATTLMANGEAFEDAVRLAREHPTLDIGCHLVLIQGRSLLTGEELPCDWKQFLRALTLRRIDPYQELHRQVEMLITAGITPSHFDTHKHTHVHPRVMGAVMRLAREFHVPFIRLPFDAGWWPVQMAKQKYAAALRRAGIGCTDYFTGFRLTDSLDEPSLAATLRTLLPGSTELMCHPGYLRDDLRRAATRLKESRERELRALTSPAIAQLAANEHISLTTYRELANS